MVPQKLLFKLAFNNLLNNLMLQKPTLNSGSIAIPITKPNKVVPNEINGLHPIFLPYCLSETIETRENATVEFPRL